MVHIICIEYKVTDKQKTWDHVVLFQHIELVIFWDYIQLCEMYLL